MFQHSSQAKRPKLSLFKETPPDTTVEEQQDAAMVSSTGGHPFRKNAYFLKPIAPYSSIDEPPFKLPLCFSSLPSRFDPKGWPLKLPFTGWRLDHYDLQTWVERLAPIHQWTWKKAGIYEAIFSSTYEIKRRKDLVCGFAEKWCCETNTFIFPWGEATITLEDVMVLGGFSVLGDSVFSPLKSTELKEVEEKLEQKRLGLRTCTTVHTRLWMEKFMNSGSELEHEAFLVFWLARYVFNHHNMVKEAVISIAIRLARGIRVALAPAVLASIYKELSILKTTLVSDEFRTCDDVLKLTIHSPFQLVQVWAWERFLELRPKPNVISYGEPRMARWDKVDGLNVQNWRRVLDSAGEDFMWRPYAMAIENWNPKYYLEKDMRVCPGLDDELLSFAICLRVTELDGFVTTTQYLPHRVARQFGFDQDIPCSVDRSDKDSNMLCGKKDPHRAWKHHIREIKNVNLSVPSRLSEADVSTRYLKWWEKTVSCIKHMREPSMPEKKKENSTQGSLPKDKHVPMHPGFLPKKVVKGSTERNMITDFAIPSVSYLKSLEKLVQASKGSNEGNDSFFPPGFPPRGDRIEAGAPMDDYENVKTRKCGDREKLSGEVQNLESSMSFEGSNNCMLSGKIEKEISLSEALVGGSKAKSNVETIKGYTARSQAMNTKQFSELKAKVSRLESVVDMSQANAKGASFRNN
ncbi:uncharacterized protein LOC121049098 isoform X2 [Rosa chinensis]|uniref:uncharacterized protein LOC121049098 isoform X2 n=1 Tax=Rosa chinensis TaxID=74649 RepID=UPI001AD93CBB|nr:uncharacterized protein LOC121049098 isoform X2 [Rosa chinensis]